jgi:hypothetical protein
MVRLALLLALSTWPAGLIEGHTIEKTEMTEQTRTTQYLTKRSVRQPEMYASLIHQEIPPHLRKIFAAKLVRESGGRTDAVSRCGCRGPWQVNPRWARIFKVRHMTEPRTNLRLALRVFRVHLDDAHGSVWNAVLAYSGGSRQYVSWVQREIRDM